MKDRLILDKTLKLFLKYGVKKTSLEMIAHETGLSRMTIYRKFQDKKEIVRLVLLQVIKGFESSLEELYITEKTSLSDFFTHFNQVFSLSPFREMEDALDEIKKLYPDLFQKISKEQQEAGKKYFDKILIISKNQNSLKKEIKPEFLQIVIETLLHHLPEHPLLFSRDYALEEIFSQITKIILFGILN